MASSIPAPSPSAGPSSATTSATDPKTATTTPASFTERLDAEMKRIASHASKVETLKNGAKLYFLANGREVEQAPGKTPYVVKAGTKPAAPAKTPAQPTPSTTPPSTTAPSTTTPSTTTSSPTTPSTTPTSKPTTTP